MPSCDLCPRVGDDVETLGFDHRGRPGRPGVWRIARVCQDCREEHLMPALRMVFSGEGINLGDPDSDGWRTVRPEDHGASFFAFEGTDTLHAARAVKRAVLLPDEWRCVGHCGIERRTEPLARDGPIRAREEGVMVCARCARVAPPYKVGGQHV